MLLLGIDLGTSSIKVSIIDSSNLKTIASAQYPETEAEIISIQNGWAEQNPELWWENVKQAILKCNATSLYHPKDIKAIGIAYQMHGLVLVDKKQRLLRNSIIWCDSRAVDIGEKAFEKIGEKKCLAHLLNSPGNFTASKLAWVKNNEPKIYEQIDKVLLPGDFIAMKLTGHITTTMSALSECILWDFKENDISKDVLNYFNFNASFFPKIQPVFFEHGRLNETIASYLSLTPEIPITYKAGDQLNNALSLNVLKRGEVAATAGTSGVIYGVSDQLKYDKNSRINSFAHINHLKNKNHIGVLLCINGAGIFYRWLKNLFASHYTYDELNNLADCVPAGSGGILALPFGNGAERMLKNKIVNSHFHNFNFNFHSLGHLVRSSQEGIAFAFRYGLDIMKENGINPSIIRAGKSNMFLSKVFTKSFVNATGVPVELHHTDGSIGAALGAAIGAKMISENDLDSKRMAIDIKHPDNQEQYETIYQEWKKILDQQISITEAKLSTISMHH